MSTAEAEVNERLAAKRESDGPTSAKVPDVPSHSDAMAAGREVYPEGQRGQLGP